MGVVKILRCGKGFIKKKGIDFFISKMRFQKVYFEIWIFYMISSGNTVGNKIKCYNGYLLNLEFQILFYLFY